MNLSLALFGCVCWIPLAVWIVCLVHWMVGGDIEFPIGLLGIGVGLMLGVLAIHPPVAVPLVSPIACGTAFITVFAFPLVRAFANHHQLKEADIMQVDRAYRVLGNSPANQLAKFKLAESIYKLGLIGHAVAVGDVALANLPERIAGEEYRMLRRWKRAGVPPETLKPIPCVECQTPCLPGWTHCRNCGAPFLLDRVRGRFLPSGFVPRLVAVWVSAVILLIGLPVSFSLPTLSAVGSTLLIFGLVGAIGVLTFRPPKRAAP